MASLKAWEDLSYLLAHPHIIGIMIGFKDMTELHSEWIKEIVFGDDDYTLQAHRGSFKSSALAVAIALIMVLFPMRNIIFLRKTDTDVSEMMGMVGKILRSKILKDIAKVVHDLPDGIDLEVTSETTNNITTNLWNSPMGADQLLGLGVKSSITGKHAYYVITDDICNLTDRISRAEREFVKLKYDELQNIKNRDGRIINLGTPWHKEDVFSKMPNIHRYDCYTTHLISPEKLERLRASMTASLFAANYEMKHIADKDALFQTSRPFTSDISMLRNGRCHIDAAYSGSDYTAFTCAAYRDGHLYVYGKLWRKHVEKVLDIAIAEADRLVCWPMYNEDNGDKGFVTEIVRKKGKWAKSYHESENKFIKISSYLVKWWPYIIFVEGTDEEYINQIMDFTIDADHDDAPDSAATMGRIFKRYLPAA